MKTHGKSHTRTHVSWSHMKQRCKAADKWKWYGARGITVCERWKLFENFLADMGERPEGTSLDRIDNSGNYEPGNCRWATTFQQIRNSRKITSREKLEKIKWLRLAGLRQQDIAVHLGLSRSTVEHHLLKMGLRGKIHGTRLTLREMSLM